MPSIVHIHSPETSFVTTHQETAGKPPIWFMERLARLGATMSILEPNFAATITPSCFDLSNSTNLPLVAHQLAISETGEQAIIRVESEPGTSTTMIDYRYSKKISYRVQPNVTELWIPEDTLALTLARATLDSVEIGGLVSLLNQSHIDELTSGIFAG